MAEKEALLIIHGLLFTCFASRRRMASAEREVGTFRQENVLAQLCRRKYLSLDL